MGSDPAVRIRQMEPGDVDFATALTHQAGWASESLDVFQAFLEHDAHGCFVAEAGGEKAGICIATKFARNGFIGELVVSRHLRLLGIGQILFQKALEYLQERGTETICLDGDLNAVSFYESMGFRKVCRSLRFRGKIRGKRHGHIRRLQPEDLDRLCALDREYFGDDRCFFLRRRAESNLGTCLVSERDGRLGGWIMARPGDGLLAVGPWAAAADNEDAVPLLEHLADENGTVAFRLGVLETNAAAARLLRAWPGLQEGIHSWRMVRGPNERLGDHPALYAIGSGAKG
ncbi:MAG: GNAT family N-acetyltransferase [Candidatus Aminicenantes bacterium]|nr:GNAT family N-acetyltransferase [Candidatus Aminicenantes bacterium]